MYNPRNDAEALGTQPLYAVWGDLDVTQQFGPSISPKVDITTSLGNGAPFGLKKGSLLTALLIAGAVLIAIYVVLGKGNPVKF